MMYKCHPIQYYDFSSADRLLLDTNIWLYIFGPAGRTNAKVIRLYSEAFKRMLEAGSRISIDTLIISEFINSYARFAWKQRYAKTYGDFKKFRQSPKFKSIAEDIAASIRLIMNRCRFVGSYLEHSNALSLIDEYAKGDSDFNDQVLAHICQSDNLTLVTHDGDFFNQDITLISANKKLMV